MSEIQKRKKDLLHQLIKAKDAVKRKYNLLKSGKEQFEKAIGETFKPIVDPLHKLVGVSSINKQIDLNTGKLLNKDNTFFKEEETSDIDEAIKKNEVTFQERDNESDFETAAEEAGDYGSDEIFFDKYIELLNQSDEKSYNVDQIYGVRKVDGKYMIGNKSIVFDKHNIWMDNFQYPKTVGLLELLIIKHPNENYVTQHDLNNYQSILDKSSAHRKRYKSDEVIRYHNSNKFRDIISPLFPSTEIEKQNKKGGSLPKYKIVRKKDSKMDYIYWDDPNELIDRLRLLLAKMSAGNQSFQ